MRAKALITVMAVIGVVGCDSSGPSGGVDESELQFLRFPPDLLPLVTTQGSFWAVAGEGRELIMRYLPEPGETEGEEFLRFKVESQALLRRPDGTRFQDGDSIRITVQVSPDGRFLFDFQPSGLRFNPEHPARLKVIYRRADDDIDDDGDVDGDDDAIEQRLRVWRREDGQVPWYPVGSLRVDELEEIEGFIVGFTGFAIAG